ncbi:hypothetical protein [Burkholderia stabilis]
MSLSCGAVRFDPDIGAVRQRILPALKQAALELEILLREVRYEP